jgi:hypothetical protein
VSEPRLTDAEWEHICAALREQGVDSADEGMGATLLLAQQPPNEVRKTYGLPIPGTA